LLTLAKLYVSSGFAILAGYGGGKASGFDPLGRQQIDPFYSNSADDLKDFFRFEISVGLVFPEIKSVKGK
jgi:hypothetical protein